MLSIKQHEFQTIGQMLLRYQSLLMPGRGPEYILIGTKNSWPLSFPSVILMPSFYSCDFSWPHSPCKVPKVWTGASLKKNVFFSEITDVVERHFKKMEICLAKREKPAKKRIVFIDLIVIFGKKLL